MSGHPSDEVAEAEPALVLVVDDSRTGREKLRLAVESLGHRTVLASDGEEALAQLRVHPIDIVLLDIVMPRLDGFAVLSALRDEETFDEVPVIVISSLRSEAASVARAIELGADDFLPSEFNRAILNARLEASLAKKRLRDRERAIARDVRRLAQAALLVERTGFDPRQLGLDGLAGRRDAIGDLGRVFVGMAEKIHRRELAYRQRVSLLRGGFVLLFIGLIYGSVPPLMRSLMSGDRDPVGTIAWISLFASAFMTLACALRGRLPLSRPWRPGSAVLLGLVGTVAPQFVLLQSAQHLPATVLSIVIVMQSLFAFVLAAALRIEAPTVRRFLGVLFGIACVGIIVLPEDGIAASVHPGWVLLALLAPLCHAVASLLIAHWPAADDDSLSVVSAFTLCSTLALLPAVLLFGTLPAPPDVLRGDGSLIPLIAAITCLANCLIVHAVRTTGTVFASQRAYAITFAGVVWSMLLLSEAPGLWVWAALACMVAGLVLVGPRQGLHAADTPAPEQPPRTAEPPSGDRSP